MKIEISREEFEIIVGALDYQIKKQTEKIERMYQDIHLYSKRSEKELKQMIEAARKVLEEKFDPILDKENRKALEKEEFILATLATEKWELSDSTIRRAIHDGRIKKNECKKEGRDWKVNIASVKRLYGEPKHKIKWDGFGDYY